jgi:hypothetical protein
MAESAVEVELVAVKHKDERVTIPSEFKWAQDINKYAWEYIEPLKDINPHKPLPRLKDIIFSLYDLSDAEYFIYTNVDIGLYPHFYIRVKDIIENGYDAFCINRRDLPKDYKGILLDENELELICLAEGIKHAGIDCCVFKKEIVPSLNLGNVYVGFPPVGNVLKTQVEVNSKNFIWIKDERLTFHLGSDRPWRRNKGYYYYENYNQAKGLFFSSPNKPLHMRLKNKLKSWLYSGLRNVIQRGNRH